MNRLLVIAATTGLSACASADSGAPVDAAVGRVDSALLSKDSSTADMSSTDAAPTNSNCDAALTCTSAMALGTVSGDTGAGTLSASGYQAAWFRVRVTEDYSDSPGLALRVLARLTSPSGSAFDAFVYVNAATDTIECNTTTGTVTSSGNVKEVRAEWGEGFIPNGADDSRDVTIEVRPTAGASCMVGQSWQLQIDGNWL